VTIELSEAHNNVASWTPLWVSIADHEIVLTELLAHPGTVLDKERECGSLISTLNVACEDAGVYTPLRALTSRE
jgi:hypothetical protein